MPAVYLFPRSETSLNSVTLSPTYIAGIIVAVVIILGVSTWLGLRLYRKHAAARRESKMGAAFLSVKGLVPEDSPSSFNEKFEPAPSSGPIPQLKGFSRNMMDSGVVLPARTRPTYASPGETPVEPYPQSPLPNTLAPSSARPFLFALNTNSSDSTLHVADGSPMISSPQGQTRNSWVSWTSMATPNQRFSVVSVMSGTSSFDVTTTSGTARKVRQLFEPVLPDELVIRLGEQLTVVQSFEDGWCVVGRESSLVHTVKSLFKPNHVPEPESNVELGVVPAWCFLKPVKGLRAERPVRSTSLGVTVNLEAPTGSRNDMMSWSNF